MVKIYKIILFSLLLGFSPVLAHAASLSFSSLASPVVGSTFSVNVLVTSTDQSINAASGTVSFPWDKLEIVSISKTGSIFSLWAEEPSFSNSAGTVSFEGIVLNPGFIGANGKILTINFRAKLNGQANLSFSSGSVLANDGSGTNILSDLRVAVVLVGSSSSIIPEVISGENIPTIHSITHPDSTLWYASKNPEFSWQLPKGTLAVRTGISKSSNTVPSVLYEPPIAQKKIENLSDGTYYFALQIRDANGWGKVGRYKVNIDTTPPEPFSITFPHGNLSLEPQPVILFNTKDIVSGISHYDIKINDGGPDRKAPQASSNPYPLPPQKPGEYVVKVVAYDRAGNQTDSVGSFTVEAIEAPIITYYPQEIDSGDLIRVRGHTYPDSDVTIYTREGNEIVAEEKVRSNSSGDFNALITKRLYSGAYTFTVYVTDSRGANSKETEPFEIVVKSRFVADLTDAFLDYFGRVMIILLVLVGTMFTLAHLYSKTIKKIKQLRREEQEVKKITNKSFDLLRKDMNVHIAHLKKMQAKRKLTEEEISFLEEFQKNMSEAENLITKEIHENL